MARRLVIRRGSSLASRDSRFARRDRVAAALAQARSTRSERRSRPGGRGRGSRAPARSCDRGRSRAAPRTPLGAAARRREGRRRRSRRGRCRLSGREPTNSAEAPKRHAPATYSAPSAFLVRGAARQAHAGVPVRGIEEVDVRTQIDRRRACRRGQRRALQPRALTLRGTAEVVGRIGRTERAIGLEDDQVADVVAVDRRRRASPPRLASSPRPRRCGRARAGSSARRSRDRPGR